MKIKACPSIDTVRGILQERITADREYLVGKESALSQLLNNSSSLYKPGEETERRILRDAIGIAKAGLVRRETEMVVLQSHTAPSVMVEIDV